MNGMVPKRVAKEEAVWRRHMAVLRLRESGLTLERVGQIVGVTAERVRQMCYWAEFRRKSWGSPVERYMSEKDDVLALASLVIERDKRISRAQKLGHKYTPPRNIHQEPHVSD